MQASEDSPASGLSRLAKLLLSGAAQQGIALRDSDLTKLARYTELLEIGRAHV